MWFSNWTLIPEDQEATMDPLFFTVPDFHGDAWSIWDRVNCLAIEGLHYDVCKAWYPISMAMHGLYGTGSTALRLKVCTTTYARPGTRFPWRCMVYMGPGQLPCD